MSATVSGVFEILDRASRPMRKMELQALATDAAILGLGEHLDEIGTSRQIQKIDKLNRQIVTTHTGIGNLSKDTKKFGNDIDNLGKRTDNYNKKLDKFLDKVTKVGLKLGLKFGGMGGLIGVAGQGIGALAGGLVALLPKLSDLGPASAAGIAGIVGLAGSAGVAKLAFGTLTQAMQGNKMAMRDLSPQGAKLILQLHQMHGVMRQLRRTSQQGLFPGVRSFLKDFKGAAPQVNGIVGTLSKRLGGVAAQAGRRTVGNRGFMRDMGSIADQGGYVVSGLGTGLLNVVDALRHVAIAARPFTKWLTDTIVGWTKHWDILAKNGRETGTLATKFDRARRSLTSIGHVVRNLWIAFRELGKAARPAGDSMWTDMERATAKWDRTLGNPDKQAKLGVEFKQMADSTRAIMRLVGALGGALFNMGGSSTLTTTADRLTKSVPTLEKTLNSLANTVGPNLGGLVTNLAQIMQNVNGPLSLTMRLLTKVTGAVKWLLDHAGPFKGVFTEALSVMLIARFATKLGLLRKGWMGVALAAGKAAEAEGAATAMGGGGGYVGILGPRGRKIGGLFGRFRGGGAVAEEAAGVGMFAKAAPLVSGLGHVALPLMAIGGLMSLMSQSTSGGFANRLGQNSFGVLNGAGFGVPGMIGKAFGGQGFADWMNPGAARQKQQEIDQQLQEKKARAAVIAELNAEKSARKGQNDLSDLTNVWKVAFKQTGSTKKAFAATMSATAADLSAATGAGRSPQRGKIERWAAMTAYQQYRAGQITKGQYDNANAMLYNTWADNGHEGAGHGNFTIHQGRVYTGSRNEFLGLASRWSSRAEMQTEHGSSNATTAEKALIYSLQAAGFQNAPYIVMAMHGKDWNRTPYHWPGYATNKNFGSSSTGLILPYAADGAAGANAAAARRMMNPGYPQKKADGGRIGGRGLQDSVPAMLAPGELVVNRHQEAAANAMLASSGNTLGGIVSGIRRKHSARFAAGGRAINTSKTWMGHVAPLAGMLALGNRILGQFPGLSVTSTYRPNETGSWHAADEAVDFAAPMTPSGIAYMNKAAAWIGSRFGGSLLEGIHNPNLSVKNGKGVPSSFWGATTWKEHLNHIHVAFGGGASKAGKAGGVVAAMAQAARHPMLSMPNALSGFASFLGLSAPHSAAGVSAGRVAQATGTTRGSAPASANQKLGYQMMLQHGWGAGQWGALQKLWNNESGWSSTATNASGATGIPQYLPSAHGATPKGWSNPRTQIAWGLDYISGKYGTPTAALAAWNSRNPHWYNQGGRAPKFGGWYSQGLKNGIFSTPTMIGVGENGAERVTVTRASDGHHGGATYAPVFHIDGAQDPKAVAREVDRIMRQLANAIDNAPSEEVLG